MELIRWDQLTVEQMTPLITRQMLNSAAMTVARIVLKKGAVVPQHQHINEQISNILEGSLRFIVGGVEQVVSAGESLVIPPNVPHSAVADEDCVAVDLFTPPREDWISGDDAYLRGR